MCILIKKKEKEEWIQQIRRCDKLNQLQSAPFRFSFRYKGSKKGHLTNIKNKSGIDFSHMIFFDDDPANIRDVQSLGVLSVLTPQGVTRKHFEDGLEAFAARDRLE